MRTKKRLVELANKNESSIYKEIANSLSKKVFISKIEIKMIYKYWVLRYNLYEEILKKYSIWEYFYIHQNEIKSLLLKDFWGIYRFNLAYEDWKLDAISFVLSYYLAQIIKDI